MEAATVNIQDFVQHLKDNDLVIVSRAMVESELNEREVQRLKRQAKAKKMLSFKEIADARLWGKISVRAVKSYALKHAKANEIKKTKRGGTEIYKIATIAVERIAKLRGNGSEL